MLLLCIHLSVLQRRRRRASQQQPFARSHSPVEQLTQQWAGQHLPSSLPSPLLLPSAAELLPSPLQAVSCTSPQRHRSLHDLCRPLARLAAVAWPEDASEA